MSGHSKWSTIKRKKEKTDGQRAKIFTKIGREITVAIKESGADPTVNGKLRDLIAKAKTNNVPNDNIDRIIKKAVSDGDKDNFESMMYEGYGPSGVAVMVETLTDNRNRTAGDLRHYFDKYGGNLGQTGSVNYLFSQKGLIVIENNGLNEDKVMEDCLEAGAEDFSFEDGAVEIYTDPTNLRAVREALEAKNYTFLSADIEYIPSTYTKIEEAVLVSKMTRLMDMLDDNDDVQNFWHNWDEPEEPNEE